MTDDTGEFGAVMHQRSPSSPLAGVESGAISLKILASDPSDSELDWLSSELQRLLGRAHVNVMGLELQGSVQGSASSGETGRKILEHALRPLASRLLRLHLRWDCVRYSSSLGLAELNQVGEGEKFWEHLKELRIEDEQLRSTEFLANFQALEIFEVRGANNVEPPTPKVLAALTVIRFISIPAWSTFDGWLGELSANWAPQLQRVVIDRTGLSNVTAFGELRLGLPVPDVGELRAHAGGEVGWLADAKATQRAVEQVVSMGIPQVNLSDLIGDDRSHAACRAAAARKLLAEYASLADINLGSIADVIEVDPFPKNVCIREKLAIRVKLDVKPAYASRVSLWLGHAVERMLSWQSGPVSLWLTGANDVELRMNCEQSVATVSCHGGVNALDDIQERVAAEPLFERLGASIQRLDLSNAPIGPRTLARVHKLIVKGLEQQFAALELGPHNDSQYEVYLEEIDGFEAALRRSLGILPPSLEEFD